MTKPPMGTCKEVPSDSVFAAHRFCFGQRAKRRGLSSSACNGAEITDGHVGVGEKEP
jgi:hypothetical protein